MKFIKKLFAVCCVVAFALACYLFAPLLLAKTAARKETRRVVRWVDDRLKGSALSAQVSKALEQADLNGTVEDLTVRNNRGTAQLRYVLRYDISLFGRHLMDVPLTVELDQKLHHNSEARR